MRHSYISHLKIKVIKTSNGTVTCFYNLREGFINMNLKQIKNYLDYMEKIEKEILKEFGIDLNDLKIILIISNNNNTISKVEAYKHSNLKVSAFNIHVKKLYKLGYIHKERDVVDERTLILSTNQKLVNKIEERFNLIKRL